MLMRYFHTLRFLKPTQVYYQLFYKLRRIFRNFTKFKYSYHSYQQGQTLAVNEAMPASYESYRFDEKHQFTFLNLSESFIKIDWDYSTYGKLWTYNLNYFDFLNQTSITKEQGLVLINDFIPQLPQLENANEPYPISLRGINWVKFLSKHNISNKEIDQSLYSQYLILLNNLEYHLLGNHLLENGFSLYIGGCYFKNEKLINKGFSILKKELKEQILLDGAHYELSPMYHQILLSRLLDCISIGNSEHLPLMKNYAQKMCGWLKAISFNNGEIPLLNDSAKNIAPTTTTLLRYAEKLGINPSPRELKDSGYRKYKLGEAELIFDIGKIGPSYIPGHAHADIFNFVLSDNGLPIVVDTGISTYEKNQRRQEERSTFSHNTVEINHKNQVDVWDGFRVGKRARIEILKDEIKETTASHNGYRSENSIHQRSWKIANPSIASFIIEDHIFGNNSTARAYIHFHPSCEVKIVEEKIKVNNWIIQFDKVNTLYLQPYLYTEEYNGTKEGIVAVINFKSSLISYFNKG